MLYYLLTFGPVLLALAIAVILRFSILRNAPRLTRAVTAATAISALLATMIVLVSTTFRHLLPLRNVDTTDSNLVVAMIPLVAGVLAVICVMLPAGGSVPMQERADLTPRRVAAFVPWYWPASLILLTVIVVFASIIGGVQSTPDGQGRFTEYNMNVGTTGTRAGTSTYGWYYSTPALLAVLVLLLVTAVAWVLLARPAWRENVQKDAAVRRLRAANTGRIAVGALLLHLVHALSLLRGPTGLQVTAQTSELGELSVGTPLAGLGMLLTAGGLVALISGLALWITVALTALPLHARTGVRR